MAREFDDTIIRPAAPDRDSHADPERRFDRPASPGTARRSEAGPVAVQGIRPLAALRIHLARVEEERTRAQEEYEDFLSAVQRENRLTPRCE